MVWQLPTTVLRGVDADHRRVVDVLGEAFSIVLLLRDGHDLLERSVAGVDRPGLRVLDVGLGWVLAEAQLEAESFDAGVPWPQLSQVVDVPRIAIPVEVKDGVGARASST